MCKILELDSETLRLRKTQAGVSHFDKCKRPIVYLVVIFSFFSKMVVPPVSAQHWVEFLEHFDLFVLQN